MIGGTYENGSGPGFTAIEAELRACELLTQGALKTLKALKRQSLDLEDIDSLVSELT